jgi:CheY-like chemotaxis protein
MTTEPILRVELGPVPSSSVRAWTGNARQVLDGVLRAGPALPVDLPDEVAVAFRAYLDEWEQRAGEVDPFTWSAEVPVDVVRRLVVYLFGVLTLDDETWDRHGLPWAPPEAAPFYDVLVAAVTEGLAAADAEVGPMLEASWPEELTRTKVEPVGSRRRVVIVDDTPDIRLLFEMALNIDGRFEVVGMASDGAEGIEVCEALQPDGVLLDVMMPGMDGLTALPRIRERCPKARIVVLSADDRPEVVERAMAGGADGYVLKSSSVDDAIDSLLAG